MTQVTAERLRELLDYDRETGIFHWKVRAARSTRIGDPAGCKLNDGYLQITIDGRGYQAHRLAWLHVTGQWPADEIDHINGIRDDNRWANLRGSDSAGNCRNRDSKSNNKSGIKGVRSNLPRANSYSALIWVNGKNLYLGSFPTKEEAAEAYRIAAAHYFGEFAEHLSRTKTSA